ncbi:MAG: ankyrin repeat domain-containing protein [Elusimicrobiota bacterium]|jgi:ankyrin repeat protein|nr:ankyrin repeat domain-containing protein [Elusimicrobiota bacterium]
MKNRKLVLLALAFFIGLVFAQKGFCQDSGFKFIMAIQKDDYETFRSMLSAGENPNACDAIGHKALIVALSNKNSRIAQELVEAGADINAPYKYVKGMTALMLAIENNMEETANFLIKYGANLTAKTEDGTNVLMIASSKGMKSVVENILLSDSVNINDRNQKGLSALSMSLNKHNDVAKILNDAGVIPVDIFEAVAFGSTSTVDKMISASTTPLVSKVDAKGQTPLHHAYINNNYEIAVFLIEKGADINASDNSGLTPALICASNNSYDLMCLAIEYKADMLAKDTNNLAPIDYAVFFENYGMVEAIAKYDSQALDTVDINGFTPLDFAVASQNKRIVDLLMSSGAGIELAKSERPLNIAVSFGNISLAKFFIDNGASINAKGISNMAPLIVAARNNDINMVRFLLENGAKTNTREDENFTPIDYAKKNENLEMVKLLESYKK